MFTRLTRYAYAPIAALALWAVLLAALPATAHAQGMSPTKDPQVTNRDADGGARVVVAPGDCLWSISQERLGPSATPQQIANGVELIYALNRNQIGSDPDLIFAGQRLLLPPALERQAPEPGRAPHSREAAGPAKVAPTTRAADSETNRVSRPAFLETDARVGKTPEPATGRAILSDEAAAAPVPAVRSLVPDSAPRSPAASFLQSTRSMISSAPSALVEAFAAADPYAGRKLLGGAILAMSSVGALVLVLRVVREVSGPARARRRARERWVWEAFGKNYAYHAPFANDNPNAAPVVAFGHPPSERGPQEAAKPAPLEELQQRAVSEQSGNGSSPSDGVRRHAGFTAIARSKGREVRGLSSGVPRCAAQGDRHAAPVRPPPAKAGHEGLSPER